MLKWARFALAGLIFFGGSLLLCLLAVLRPFNPEVAVVWCRWVPPLGLKALNIDFEVRHWDRMKTYHPCVLIANHQHALDLLIHGSMTVRPTVVIGKKEVKWVPFFGLIFWLTGMIFIDRKNRGNAMETMRHASDRMVRERLSVWMFPEGTRAHGKGLLPFKKGAFHLAVAGQVPIVPVVATSFLRHLDFNRWNPGRVIVEVLEPVSTAGCTNADVERLIQVSHENMRIAIERLDREIS